MEILLILVTHFVADFLCQTEWMALGKSKTWTPLLAHVLVYTLVLSLAGFYLLGAAGILYACINGVLHGLVDYYSSRAMRAAHAAGDSRRFFAYLGLDQLAHQACLIGLFLL